MSIVWMSQSSGKCVSQNMPASSHCANYAHCIDPEALNTLSIVSLNDYGYE